LFNYWDNLSSETLFVLQTLKCFTEPCYFQDVFTREHCFLEPEVPANKMRFAQPVSTSCEDDEISDCSDVEEEGYADFTQSDLEPLIAHMNGMKLKPTTNKEITQLFNEQRKVRHFYYC